MASRGWSCAVLMSPLTPTMTTSARLETYLIMLRCHTYVTATGVFVLLFNIRVCLISVCSGDNCHSSREGWGLVELLLVGHQQPVQQLALQWQLLFTTGFRPGCDESSNDISSNSALPHPRSCFTVYQLRSRICDVREVFLGGNTSAHPIWQLPRNRQPIDTSQSLRQLQMLPSPRKLMINMITKLS